MQKLIQLDFWSRIKRIRLQLRLPVFLGIRLHPKTSHSLRFQHPGEKRLVENNRTNNKYDTYSEQI